MLEWLRLPLLRIPSSRPHVPFNKVRAHTVPTKWSLYRPILRCSPDSETRRLIKTSWKLRKSQLSPEKIRGWLVLQYKVLEAFRNRRFDDPAVVRLVKSEKRREWRLKWDGALKKPQSDDSLRSPTRTPSLIPASFYNPPMLRLKPMPEHLAMMHHHRRRRMDGRLSRLSKVYEMVKHAGWEQKLEKSWGFPETSNWKPSLQAHAKLLGEGLARDKARSELPITAELLEQRKVARARRHVYWQKRAKERRFRGKCDVLHMVSWM